MPLIQMLALTAHEDKEHLFTALKSGASGYLLKDSAPSEIIETIEDVYNHCSPMSPRVARYVIEYFSEMELKRRRIETILTEREIEILGLRVRVWVIFCIFISPALNPSPMSRQKISFFKVD